MCESIIAQNSREEKMPLSSFQIMQNECKCSRVRIPPYTFKKKKPPPGAYPLHFSPYRLSVATHARIPVSLSRQEILSDLQDIQNSTAAIFKSTYFDETGVQESSFPLSEASKSPANFVTNAVPRSVVRHKPRVQYGLEAPLTPEEERRQIRAAIRASKELAAAHVPANPTAESTDASAARRTAAVAPCSSHALCTPHVVQAPLLSVAGGMRDGS
jgi:hypothetical protein